MRHAILALILTLSPCLALAGIEDVEVRETTFTGGEFNDETFRYQFLKPAKIEAGKSYPLVLFLHGAGERGDDPEVLKKHFLPAMASDEFQEKFPCFVVAPQCRTGHSWTARRRGGPEGSDELGVMQKMALQCVDDVVKEFPVDKNRLYLTGLSMGGYGSWDLATRQSDRWAAVVPICGGGDPSKAAKLVDVPLWAVHGDADPAVPVEESRKMIAAIKAAGGSPEYTEYPGVVHDSWTQAYADPKGVISWMFEQRLDQRKKKSE